MPFARVQLKEFFQRKCEVIKVKRGAFWEREVNHGGGMAATGPTRSRWIKVIKVKRSRQARPAVAGPRFLLIKVNQSNQSETGALFGSGN
jgi:hypothetical protein